MPSTYTSRIDGVTTSVAVKAPCRVVTNANITLSGEQTINGVAVVDGDRVLVKDQSTASQNGIYVASTTAWERAKDFNGSRDAVKGTLVFAGAPNDGNFYAVNTADGFVIGTDNISFVAWNFADPADIAAVLAIDTEIGQVAAIDDDVTTVAGIAAEVTAVAAIDADIATVAANIADIQNAEENADIAKAAGGFTYTYSSTTASADPGAGFVRFNNATLSSATAMYISETTGLSQAISSELATWDDSTSTIRTKLRLFKQSDPSVFVLFNITGTLTDNGTWDTFTVAYVSGTTSLTNNDVLTIQPIRNGDKGDIGTTGPAGSLQIANAAGTVDAITADFSPDLTLADNLVIQVVNTAGANTVTNPTLNTDGSGALTIKARGNAALVAGDTGAAGYTMTLRYEATGTYWELQNPAKTRSSDISGAVSEANGGTNQTSYAQGDILYASASNTLSKLAKGTALQVLRMNSGATVPEWGTASGTIDYQAFTSSGTWTNPASGTIVYVQVWGAGGDGGKGNTQAGGGGGGGAYTEAWLRKSDLVGNKTVTVAAAGSGQSTINTSGATGGTSDFASLVYAYGGGGGKGANAATNGGGGGGGRLSAGQVGADTTQTVPADITSLLDVLYNGTTVTAAGRGGAPLGGVPSYSTNNISGSSALGGGAGGSASAGSNSAIGGSSFYGGGGGGRAGDATTVGGAGGTSIWGGGGGGGAAQDSSPGAGAGGTSVYAGAGGAGGFDANNGTSGTAPAGGGGGSESGTSGAGARGEVRVYTF